MLSPFEIDILRISENVLDERRRSAKAINPWTDNFRLSRSTGPTDGASTGSDKHDLWLTDWSSCSFSSVIVGVNWFLFTFSSGVLSVISGVSGVFGLQSSGSDMHILFTDKLSGLIKLGMSRVVVFCKSKTTNLYHNFTLFPGRGSSKFKHASFSFDQKSAFAQASSPLVVIISKQEMEMSIYNVQQLRTAY